MDRSPFTRGGRSSYKPYESSIPDSDISFVSSGRPSIERMLPSMFDDLEPGMAPRLSNSSDFDGRSSESSFSGARSIDMNYSQGDFSFSSQDSGGSSSRLSLSVRTTSRIKHEQFVGLTYRTILTCPNTNGLLQLDLHTLAVQFSMALCRSYS